MWDCFNKFTCILLSPKWNSMSLYGGCLVQMLWTLKHQGMPLIILLVLYSWLKQAVRINFLKEITTCWVNNFRIFKLNKVKEKCGNEEKNISWMNPFFFHLIGSYIVWWISKINFSNWGEMMRTRMLEL